MIGQKDNEKLNKFLQQVRKLHFANSFLFQCNNAFPKGNGADSKSPIGTAFAFSPPCVEALSLSNTSILLEFASRAFIKSLEDVTSNKSRFKRQAVIFEDDTNEVPTRGEAIRKDIDLRSFVVSSGSMGAMKCGIHDEVLPCDPNNPYRTYSGWCNNLRNPGWGKSVITFDRMIPSAYADGVSRPRSTSAIGRPLPSPRHISSYVHIDVSHLSTKHTLMLMQYGKQFIKFCDFAIITFIFAVRHILIHYPFI